MLEERIKIYIIFSFFIFIFSTNGYSSLEEENKIFLDDEIREVSKNKVLTYYLYKKKFYFSSLYFAEKYLLKVKSIDEKFEKVLSSLYLKTGEDSFANMELGKLMRLKSTTIYMALGFELFRRKDLKRALEILKLIPENHKFSPEVLMTLGTITNILNKDEKAKEYYKKCQEVSLNAEKKSTHPKTKRYYAVIKESCHIHVARIHYKNKDFKGSLELYEEIPKKSYRWPYILLEKGWGHYNLKNYNKTLGILVTYKSPLLESYFIPEAEVLTALSYFKMCLWTDTMLIINKFYKFYKPQTDSLKEFLNKHKNSKDYFLKLALKSKENILEENIYIKKLLTQIKKSVKFSLDLNSLSASQIELEKLKNEKENKLVKRVLPFVAKIVRLKETSMNYFVKSEMYSFINEIHRFAYEMFNIKLEVMSKQRHLIYKDQQLVSDRSRGDLNNIDVKVDDDFWEFNGAFWADELGDYSFGLKSNCEVVNVKNRPKSKRRR